MISHILAICSTYIMDADDITSTLYCCLKDIDSVNINRF